MENNHSFGFLRTTALIALLFGAVGSLYFIINAGRNNSSILLSALFVIWVLSPFIAFLIANSISKSWSFLTRKTIYWLMLIVTVGSLIFYSAFKIPGTKRTFIFLIVPLISWLLMIIVILVTIRLLRGKTEGKISAANSN
ncbi:MAG TPA: hypothetical protein VIJ92_02590 [Ginsengibacter sp.]